MPGGFFKPLVPEAPVRKLQDEIDSPSLDRSPWMARLQGFGAGALEGLRQQTSPANLLGAATSFLPGGAIVKGAGMAEKVAPALQALKGVVPAAKTLGELSPEFTAVGNASEEAYNLGRQGIQMAKDPLESAYKNILLRGGR